MEWGGGDVDDKAIVLEELAHLEAGVGQGKTLFLFPAPN